MTRKKQPTLRDKVVSDLKASGRFTITQDRWNDGSGSWVTLKKKDTNKEVTITFNDAGTRIEDVQVHKNIKKIVDQKKLF